MKSLRSVYGKTLVRLGAEIPNLAVLDADLSKSTKTALFAEAFPQRFYDMGIAEQDMMTCAAGMATAGLVPFVSTFAVFATGRAWEQLRNSVCYPNLNVKIVATHAGITVGEDGGSHQSVEDLAVTRVIPNLRVIAPSDAAETAQVIETVAREEGPFYIRLPRGQAEDLHTDDYRFQIGKAVSLKQGDNVTLITTGITAQIALKAAALLDAQGIRAAVLALPCLKPLDHAALEQAARKTGAIVTLEEHSIIGGLGSAVAESLAEHFPVPITRVGIRDTFGQSGPADTLLLRYGLTPENTVDAAKKVIERKQKAS